MWGDFSNSSLPTGPERSLRRVDLSFQHARHRQSGALSTAFFVSSANAPLALSTSHQGAEFKSKSNKASPPSDEESLMRRPAAINNIYRCDFFATAFAAAIVNRLGEQSFCDMTTQLSDR